MLQSNVANTRFDSILHSLRTRTAYSKSDIHHILPKSLPFSAGNLRWPNPNQTKQHTFCQVQFSYSRLVPLICYKILCNTCYLFKNSNMATTFIRFRQFPDRSNLYFCTFLVKKWKFGILIDVGIMGSNWFSLYLSIYLLTLLIESDCAYAFS